jgi:hypothetical protein
VNIEGLEKDIRKFVSEVGRHDEPASLSSFFLE